MKHLSLVALATLCATATVLLSPVAARAQSVAPFVATLSNTTPLVFGMTADHAARALGVPLAYLRGRSGHETYLAIRDIDSGGVFQQQDRLFLQFRRGRLAGWKGDWGRNWMWR